MDQTIVFRAALWLYQGKGAWHFITLPTVAAKQVKFFAGKRRGWGSVKVMARIGQTVWKTSLFPDSKTASYQLPIKAEVRIAERLELGKPVQVTIKLQT